MTRAAIPRTVWALGLVSLFMDVSSEIIHSLLPLFLTTTFGASVALVGLIDGVGEATAAVSKMFSGWLSDRIGKRKPLILLGYGLAALSKPLFALAQGPLPVFTARFADRIGKGLRGAPRDALVADVTPPEIRGRAFGLRQAMDTAGAFVGPLAAIGLMAAFANNFRAVFWVAVIPAGLAVLCVLVGVEDRTAPRKHVRLPIRWGELSSLGNDFRRVLVLGVVFTLARFSEAFLVLKANEKGLPLMLAPLVLVVMNFVYAAGAYPAGGLADRIQARRLLLSGIGTLIAADLALGLASGLVGVFVGIALWGAHMALTQGLLSKLVADSAPPEFRGTAFGIFNLASGMSLLGASVVAGLLWDRFGSSATFLAGGAFALVAAVLVSFQSGRQESLGRNV